MKTHSIITAHNTGKTGNDLIVLGCISEGKRFRILKARRDSRFLILKVAKHQGSMSLSLLAREYELAARLNHPCIVSTTGFLSESPAGPAITMEYIDGLTLDEFISTNPSGLQKRAVLNDIIEGVEYLHRRGILHNDLKPDNIIVNRKGAAHIIDFDLSGSEDSIYEGVIGGTSGYTAPEILEGKGPAGAASDIYSQRHGPLHSFRTCCHCMHTWSRHSATYHEAYRRIPRKSQNRKYREKDYRRSG